MGSYPRSKGGRSPASGTIRVTRRKAAGFAGLGVLSIRLLAVTHSQSSSPRKFSSVAQFAAICMA